MKNKSLIIVAALLVILIAAAGILYPVLAEKAAEDRFPAAADNFAGKCRRQRKCAFQSQMAGEEQAG